MEKAARGKTYVQEMDEIKKSFKNNVGSSDEEDEDDGLFKVKKAFNLSIEASVDIFRFYFRLKRRQSRTRRRRTAITRPG